MTSDSNDLWLRNWASVESVLGGCLAIDRLAFATGAMRRRRAVRDGSQLLRMALNYAAGGQSLRTAAGWSGAVLDVSLSDPALIGRLGNCGDFLASIVGQLLALSAGPAAAGVGPAAMERRDGPPLRLVDGSMFTGPGKGGVQHRLHATFDPLRGWFTSLELTGNGRGSGGNLSRCGIEKAALVVADRNYCRTGHLRQVVEGEGFFCVRAGVSCVRMLDPATGDKITAAAIMAALGEAESAEMTVHLAECRGVTKASAKPPVVARLVLIKPTQASLAHENARIERSKIKHLAKPRRDTLALAGLMMILTNLPPEEWPARKIGQLYRLRWQIELAFKLLKSTFEMRAVPNKTPEMARMWILTNLAATLIARLLASRMAAISPCGT